MSGEVAQTIISYSRPREKLRERGIESLSNTELIQLIIGSGTLQFNVAKIARRLDKLLKDKGGHLQLPELLEIPGIGPARAAQLCAIFELGARFPTRKPGLRISSSNELAAYIRENGATHEGLWLVTLDGNRQVIERRLLRQVAIKQALRSLCAAIVKDEATYAGCIRTTSEDMLLPSMDDLVIARDLRQLAKTLGVASAEFLLVNRTQFYSVMKEVDRVS